MSEINLPPVAHAYIDNFHNGNLEDYLAVKLKHEVLTFEEDKLNTWLESGKLLVSWDIKESVHTCHSDEYPNHFLLYKDGSWEAKFLREACVYEELYRDPSIGPAYIKYYSTFQKRIGLYYGNEDAISPPPRPRESDQSLLDNIPLDEIEMAHLVALYRRIAEPIIATAGNGWQKTGANIVQNVLVNNLYWEMGNRKIVAQRYLDDLENSRIEPVALLRQMYEKWKHLMPGEC